MPSAPAEPMWLVRHGFYTAVLRDGQVAVASPATDEAGLARALALRYRGQFDAATEILEPLALKRGPLADEAFFALLEIEQLSGRAAAIEERLRASSSRRESDRGRLFTARCLLTSDPTVALQQLRQLADAEQASPTVRRLAAFDAVGVLDASGDYREAMDLATRFHQSTASAADVRPMLHHLDLQVEALYQGILPKATPTNLPPTAFVVGLPRSGTTLVEQMLDNHPQVVGIGEYDGLPEIIHTMTSQGLSPYQFSQLSTDSQSQLRQLYVDGARLFNRERHAWTLDISLMSWFSLPFLAELFPAGRYVSIKRDPRDVAVSIMLSWFDANRHPWTTRFQDIYDVLFRTHTLLPRCLSRWRLEHVHLRYEDLVANPRDQLGKALALLGLPFVEAALSPELNTRAVTTLSFADVSRPLYTSSIGRWRNYDWMFEKQWHLLAESAGY